MTLIVHAQPGFGKTTLANTNSNFIECSGLPVDTAASLLDGKILLTNRFFKKKEYDTFFGDQAYNVITFDLDWEQLQAIANRLYTTRASVESSFCYQWSRLALTAFTVNRQDHRLAFAKEQGYTILSLPDLDDWATTISAYYESLVEEN